MLQLSPSLVLLGLYSAEAVKAFAGALDPQPKWKCQKPRLQQVVRGSDGLRAVLRKSP